MTSWVKQLKRVLSEGPEGAAFDSHYVDVEPSRVGEHRRAVEALVADVVISDVTHLDDPRLTGAIAQLAGMEHQVSHTRHDVQRVLDLLASELSSRVERGSHSR